MKQKLLRPFIALVFLLFIAADSNAQEGFLGEIKLVGFNFTPRGWATCEGQLLPINQNRALFSLLGTMYGGDGRTTFALPDMWGRVPVGVGTGPGLKEVRQGQTNGPDKVAAAATGDTVKTITPYVAMRYVICLAGIFPSRN